MVWNLSRQLSTSTLTFLFRDFRKYRRVIGTVITVDHPRKNHYKRKSTLCIWQSLTKIKWTKGVLSLCKLNWSCFFTRLFCAGCSPVSQFTRVHFYRKIFFNVNITWFWYYFRNLFLIGEYWSLGQKYLHFYLPYARLVLWVSCFKSIVMPSCLFQIVKAGYVRNK